ncbi:MAG: hypothetical protein QXZ43_03145 [Candidatus Aenigmatarchaeota archaeon]
MRGSYEEIKCPFCDKGKIKCWYLPSSTKIRRLSGSFGKRYDVSKSAESWIIQSDCNICKRTREEIEKVLKKGKNNKETEKKVMERLKKDGLLFREIRTKIK